MTIKYGEFSFDPCHGFTGSTGKKNVKGYMRGGFAMGGMRKMRSDKGFTKKVDPPKQYPSAGPNIPGMLGQNSDAGPDLNNPTPPAPLALQGIARKKGGKC
jgi:hypothetical protein